MKFIDLSSTGGAGELKSLNRRYNPDDGLLEQVRKIVDRVRFAGDDALVQLIEQFDRVVFAPAELRVALPEINDALGRLDPSLQDTLQIAKKNVQEFARRSLRTDWVAENAQGAEVGERFHPFQRVGIYVPAGTAPLVSSAIMTVCLAATAGVPEIVAVSPVGPSKKMDPALLGALQIAGATEIYKVGGAHAIAALAFGTATVARVDKIFGPGNAFVTEAKRQVFGYVAVDLLPGPSEILVIADGSASAPWVAADLLAQAEHGPGSVIGVISPDRPFLEMVERELAEQIATLPRATYLREVLSHRGYLVLARDLTQAVRFANDFAPEHLAVVTKDAEALVDQIRNAGAVFVGPYSPVVAGDFVAGPSHELPTGGAGKSFGGLTADQFQRRTSIVKYSRTALLKSLPALENFSSAEQLEAHGRSARIRFGSERQ